MRRSLRRRPRARPGLALVALLAACAGAERAPDQDVAAGRAIHAVREEPGDVVLSGSHLVLASRARATVAAPDSARARKALDDAFAAADSVERLLALHRADSEIARINAAAGQGPVAVSPWTERALAEALRWAERTGGAYDPTVGPVVELWGFGRSAGGRLPTDAELAAGRELVGWDKVRHDTAAHTVELPLPGMVLDLGGAAKGFALDRMRDAMTAAGANSGIADLDGDAIFFGPGMGSSPDRWPIALPDPYDPDTPYARFETPPGAVATSAALDRVTVIRGVRYGHLIDPRTARPVERGLASATAYAPDGVTADILATALYVLGPLDGPRLIERWPGIEAALVTEPEPGSRGVVILTTGLEQWMKELVPPYRPRRAEDD